ncbi:hypothetical protein OK414_29530 [Priestia sp. JV24]|nr:MULTISPECIES: hypothetical protein [Priestia]MCU7713071.1 hypothetical protein [Priestia megaterium]MCW1049196.1 hypothetical protein [Priestia sp. JV24]
MNLLTRKEIAAKADLQNSQNQIILAASKFIEAKQSVGLPIE